jgi:hypothetical protein
MDGTMCGNELLGYFAGARLGRSEDIGGGLTEGWINLYRIFRPDIVVADYSSTPNPFSTASSNSLLGHAALQSIKSKMQVTSSNIVDDDYLLDGRIVKTKRNSSGYPTL